MPVLRPGCSPVAPQESEGVNFWVTSPGEREGKTVGLYPVFFFVLNCFIRVILGLYLATLPGVS